MNFLEELKSAAQDSQKLVVGIDPGKASGGFFVTNENMKPLWWRGMKDLSNDDLYELFLAFGIMKMNYHIHFVVEKIHCNGKNGSKANWSMGMNKGEIEMALRFIKVTWELVTPQYWQKQYTTQKSSGFSSKTAWKGHLHDIAKQYFPNAKIPKYMADAALLSILKTK